MGKIEKDIDLIEKKIKEATNNNPDYIFKNMNFFDYDLKIIFCESLSSRDIINRFVLEFLEEKKNDKLKIKDLPTYLEQNLPAHKIVKVDDYYELLYDLCSGFTVILASGFDTAIAIETKGLLNSTVAEAKNETVLKGPNDAFTENYQTNLGLIRRRLKSEFLWIEEETVGKSSKTKVAIMYMSNLASEDIVNNIKQKIKNIDIDAVIDGNYVVDTISGNTKHVFPTYLSTERPDLATVNLLEGKIILLIENSRLAIILPTLFIELFQNPEDLYQTATNANYTRIVRYLAFVITLLTPAFYVAVTTYNHETIPSNLLVNFATQRDGVPLPTILEAILMLLTFDILRETDARIPSIIGSSLSIVGALVLGDAAVTAGIVSPIMVIVIAITSISGFILTYFEVINGIRWWRLLFLIASALAGMIGIIIVGLIFILDLSSMKSLGVPYLTPVTPLIPKDLMGTLLITKKSKFQKRKSFLTSKDVNRGKEMGQ